MPRKWKEYEYEYQKQYAKDNLCYVKLSFNRNKPEDMEILERLNSIGVRKRASYIKELIRNDLKQP